MKTTTKDFDCIEFKRKAALRIHATLSRMTEAEQLEYWNQRMKELEALQAAARTGSDDGRATTPAPDARA